MQQAVGELVRESLHHFGRIEAGEAPREVLQRLAHQLTNRLLHAPSTALRQAALDGDVDLLRAADKLYKGGDEPGPAS